MHYKFFRSSLAIALLMFFAALLVPSLHAQTTFGTIEGVVTDASGALIPDATVTVTNKGTNQSRRVTTDAVGFFVVHSLNPGVYSITAETTGFTRQVLDEVTLEVNQTLRQDFALQVGAVTETVEVQATAALLQTSNATVGTVITNRDVVNMPLNGRSFVELINLAPGAFSRTQDQSGGGHGRTEQSSPAINGTRGQDNNYTLDGIENNEVSWNTYAMTPSVDAIQEFKVQSSTTSGEFGRAAGANINVVIKSGTNAYHGNVYEFIRNDAFDAQDFFGNSEGLDLPEFKWNQFGATFGGPIKRDRTFFFGAYEGFRLREAGTNFTTVPTADLLSGDLSSLGVDIFDPDTTDPNTLVRTQFPGNIIPTNRFNPAAAAYLSLWPAPNRPGTTNNLVNSLPNSERHDELHIKVDHMFSDSTNLFTRFSHKLIDLVGSSSFPNVTNLGGQRAYNAVIGLTHIFTPTTVMDLKLGYNRNKLPSSNCFEGTDREQFLQTAGIQGLIGPLPCNTVPGISFPEFDFNSGGFVLTGPHDTWQGKGTFRQERGRHSFSAGFDIRKNHVQYHPDDGSSGGFEFDANTTADLNNPGSTGSGFASFLLGYPGFGSRILGDTKSHQFNWNYNVFIGDDWRVTDKMTLNLSLRYEYNQQPVTFSDQFSNLEFTRDSSGNLVANLLHVLPNPFPNPTDGVFEAGNTRRAIMDPDWNNFAPRIGIAYRVTPKTVVRAGYAIFYASTYFQQGQDLRENFPLLGQEGPSQSTQFPTSTMQNFFSVAGSQGAWGGWPQNKRNRNSYSQQWNFTIEQQLLQDTTLSVAYVGQKGTKLILYTDINNAPPGEGDPNLRRPIQTTTTGFAVEGVNSGENIGISNYHSLQSKLTKRFRNGFQMLTSYTWSKSMDLQSSLFDNSQVQDPRNLRGDYGRSSWDQRHTYVTSFIYELPFGNGRAFGRNMSGVANAIVGGWRTTGILRFATGPPIHIFMETDVANTGGWGVWAGGMRPSLVSGQNASLSPGQRSVSQWFNTSAFFTPGTDPNTGLTTDGGGNPIPKAFGTFGRNVIDGPGTKALDFGLAKEFHFSESRRLEFRAEFFNLFNHPVFGLPDTNFESPQFGQIISQQNDPRQLQFALKYYF